MAKIAEMTQLSPTMSEGTIVNWLKKEGDPVSPGDIIAEVETDKAVMEMEAFDSGILLSILAKPGMKVAVGLPVAIIGEATEDITELKKSAEEKLRSGASSSSGASPAAPSPPPKSVKREPVPQSKTAAATKDDSREPSFPKTTERNLGEEAVTPPTPVGRILASPLAKNLAIQNSIDLKFVKGTGPGGRILRRDVYRYIQSGQKNFQFASPYSSSLAKLNELESFPGWEEEIIPINSMRKTIAERLTSSKINLPHFYLNIEIDAQPLVNFRERFNQGIEALKEGDSPIARISLNDLIVKAVSLALERHPVLNSSWRGDHILRKKQIDVGVAVSVPDGLITPVVRNANHLSLLSLSSELRKLGKKARERKLKPEEYTDSSFTVSNLGMFGISFFTAIINEPESAILAVGAVEDKAVVKNKEIVPGKVLKLTLSCDHRVVDGAEGARFLQTLRKILEAPELLA